MYLSSDTYENGPSHPDGKMSHVWPDFDFDGFPYFLLSYKVWTGKVVEQLINNWVKSGQQKNVFDILFCIDIQ